MKARVAMAVSVSVVLWAATAHGQRRPRPSRAARSVVTLTEPMSTSGRSVFAPRLDGVSLLTTPLGLAATDAAPEIAIDIPAHVLAEPTMPVVSQNNFLADMYRVRPVDGWTWVNLGVGTAGLGIAAAFFRAAGAQASGLQLLQPRQVSVDPMAMGDPLLIFGSYSLRYDNLGSLTLQAGLGAVSSTLFRLIYAPRDNQTARYMRTFVTEYQGGWLFGFQGVIF
jgi:hypothetical protein